MCAKLIESKRSTQCEQFVYQILFCARPNNTLCRRYTMTASCLQFLSHFSPNAISNYCDFTCPCIRMCLSVREAAIQPPHRLIRLYTDMDVQTHLYMIRFIAKLNHILFKEVDNKAARCSRITTDSELFSN